MNRADRPLSVDDSTRFRFIECNGQSDDDEEDEMSSGESAYDIKEASNSDILQISTVFNLYPHPGYQTPDMILISADGIHFYIHRQRLLEASDTYWSNLLISPTGIIYPSSLRLVEDSSTLNVVLHAIYRLSLKKFSPCLSTLVAATHALKAYGISLKSYTSIGMPLFDELAVKIPSMALEVYTIAAENNLFELAREASKHLLSLQVSGLSRETTLRIGPVYLCMLCDLLMERAYVLKCLVIQPPEQHIPTETCGIHEYHELLLDWAKIAYSLVFSDSSNISPELLHTTLQPLNSLHSCPDCIQSIDRRVQAVVSRWVLTPNSVCLTPRDIHATIRP